jgi:hypothetical protein
MKIHHLNKIWIILSLKELAAFLCEGCQIHYQNPGCHSGSVRIVPEIIDPVFSETSPKRYRLGYSIFAVWLRKNKTDKRKDNGKTINYNPLSIQQGIPWSAKQT